jgi:hypothetical protein
MERVKSDYSIAFTVANGENLAGGPKRKSKKSLARTHAFFAPTITPLRIPEPGLEYMIAKGPPWRCSI